MKKTFFRYISSNMAAMAGLSAYILADTLFISLAGGPAGITVLNLALPLYSILFALGSMIGIGSATAYSLRQAGGQGNTAHLFSHALQWQLLLALPFFLLGLVRPQLWLQWMGGDEEIVAMGSGYIRILLLGAPLFMTNYSFTAFTRNDRAPARAMVAALSASGFNILFDYLFVFPFGMGIAGAALATALAPVLSSAICSTHLFSAKSTVGLRPSAFSLKELLACCSLGIAAFVGEMSSAVTTTVYNFLLLGIAGNLAVAAYGIVANLALIAMALFNGISQGLQPLVSASYGGGDRHALRSYMRMGLLTTLALEALLLALAWGFTPALTGIFNHGGDALLKAYSEPALRLYFLGFLFAGLNLLLTGMFSAVGLSLPASVMSLLRGAIAIVGFSIPMAKLWGLSGIWLSFPAAEALTLAVGVWFLYRSRAFLFTKG